VLDPTAVTVSTRGRQIKFTPERLDQIRTLVERGRSKEEIAEIIGCTVGSLQVTCSRLGISLRRPKPLNGREKPKMIEPPREEFDGWRPKHLALKLELDDRSVELPLDPAVIIALVLQAHIRGLRLSEHLAQILRDASATA